MTDLEGPDDEGLDDEMSDPEVSASEPVDGPEVEPVDDDPGSRRPRRIALAVGLVVLAFVAAVAAVLVLRSDDEVEEYSDETQERFLAACTGDGGDDVVPVCECIYDGIRREVPYERFVEIDEQLAAQRADAPDALIEDLPADVDVIRTACVEEFGPVATTTTTTTAPPTTAPPTTAAAPPATT